MDIQTSSNNKSQDNFVHLKLNKNSLKIYSVIALVFIAMLVAVLFFYYKYTETQKEYVILNQSAFDFQTHMITTISTSVNTCSPFIFQNNGTTYNFIEIGCLQK